MRGRKERIMKGSNWNNIKHVGKTLARCGEMVLDGITVRTIELGHGYAVAHLAGRYAGWDYVEDGEMSYWWITDSTGAPVVDGPLAHLLKGSKEVEEALEMDARREAWLFQR
jgi:hypothetical protein